MHRSRLLRGSVVGICLLDAARLTENVLSSGFMEGTCASPCPGSSAGFRRFWLGGAETAYEIAQAAEFSRFGTNDLPVTAVVPLAGRRRRGAR
jgi:hypothetical protein